MSASRLCALSFSACFFGFCLAEFVGKLLFFDRIMQAELAVFADELVPAAEAAATEAPAAEAPAAEAPAAEAAK
ncbi:hypothetical protein F7O71_10790 [Neisseria meningitidis]|nr:hypothetical protein [Neisseria meningitidis]